MYCIYYILEAPWIHILFNSKNYHGAMFKKYKCYHLILRFIQCYFNSRELVLNFYVDSDFQNL